MVIPMAYLTVLDAIRAVAVLLVVASHLSLPLTASSHYDVDAMGHIGVAIFFVHTTLVLLASLRRHGESPLQFYVRRLFRIYPLSIFIVLLAAAIRFAENSPIYGQSLLSNLLLIQNITQERSYIGPLWSLPYEVQMYLFLPVLYSVISRAHRPILWCAILYAVSIVVAAYDSANLSSFYHFNPYPTLIRFAPCFIPGALAFGLMGRVPRVLPAAALAVLLAVCIVLAPWMVASGVSETPVMWALCLVMGLSIPFTRDIRWQPVARTAKTIATYSYGIYLFHTLGLWLGYKVAASQPVWVQIALGLYTAAAMSYCAHRLIEQPGIALGVRLADKLAARGKQKTPVTSMASTERGSS